MLNFNQIVEKLLTEQDVVQPTSTTPSTQTQNSPSVVNTKLADLVNQSKIPNSPQNQIVSNIQKIFAIGDKQKKSSWVAKGLEYYRSGQWKADALSSIGKSLKQLLLFSLKKPLEIAGRVPGAMKTLADKL